MLKRNSISIVVALAILGAAPAATAADKTWRFDFDVAAGAQYDSNVGVVDLDTSSGEADSVILLSGGGKLSFAPAKLPFSFSAGYDYSGTSYMRFEEFDLDLHHGVAELQYSNSYFDAALAYDQYEGVLDGESYVSISQVSPSIAHLFGSRVYTRAAWIASTRDYDLQSARNAENSALRLDTYVLLDNLDRYVSLGIQLTDETAASDEFEYSGYQVSLAYMHTFDLELTQLKLKSSLRYEDRDYAFDTPSIGAPRQDQRWRVGVEGEVPFSDHVSLHAILEHTDNSSNLDAAAVQKDTAGIELRIAF